MKTTIKVFSVLLLLLLLLAPALPASARGLTDRSFDGKVIFGQDFTLKSGETLDGDLVVFGGNVTLEGGSTVNGSVAVIGGNAAAAKDVQVDGDLVLIGGNLQMNGKIDGDMVMVGGHASLEEAALVQGNVTTIGGNLQRAAGAQIEGEVVTNPTAPVINIPAQPELPNPPLIQRPRININFGPFAGLSGVIGWAIGVALIAMVASLFLEPQMERVSTTITSQPLMAGSFGLLAVVVSAFAMLLMTLTLILIPVSMLAFGVLVLVWLFGLAAMGHEVGQRFAARTNSNWTAPLTAGVGTLLLMLVVGLISQLIPCIGWLAAALVGLAGIGGVALTYFGSRRYPLAPMPPGELPPAS